MPISAVQINPSDNVAVVTQAARAGDKISIGGGTELTATTDIPRNHKIALAGIAAGAPVKKYGEAIGTAAKDIKAGEWVHTHNLKSEGH